MQICSLQHAAVSKNTVYEHAEFSIRNNQDLLENTSKYEVGKSSQIETKEMERQNREKGSTYGLTVFTRPSEWYNFTHTKSIYPCQHSSKAPCRMTQNISMWLYIQGTVNLSKLYEV